MLFVSVFAVNQSFNNTNSSLDLTPDLNISYDGINISLNISKSLTKRVYIYDGDDFQVIRIPVSEDYTPANNETDWSYTRRIEESLDEETISDNESKSEENLDNLTKPIEFAETINGISTKSSEPNRFMDWEKNYPNLYFKDVAVQKTSSKVYTKNKEDHIRGYVIDNQKYAIHIIDCYEETQSCFFRINGVNTGDLAINQNNKNIPTEFNINNKIKLKINSIVFDFCDNKRFCDYYYEAYDIVDFSIEVDESG